MAKRTKKRREGSAGGRARKKPVPAVPAPQAEVSAAVDEGASDLAAAAAENSAAPVVGETAAAAVADATCDVPDAAEATTAPVEAAQVSETDEGEEHRSPSPCEALLQALREQGAANFDWVGLDHAERLLSRAGSLSGAAGERLQARALSYLQDYAARFALERDRASADAERLTRLGLVATAQTRRCLDQGDFHRLRQLARRHPEQELRLRDRLRAEWLAALDAEAEKRGLTSPGMIDSPSEEELERAETMDLAMALYRDAASAAHAALAIARAVDSLPIEAGRYHATTVATRTLQTMQAVPQYLRAQLQRLSLLSLLERFGAPALSAQEPPAEERKADKKAARTEKRAPDTKTKRSRTRRKAVEPEVDPVAAAG